MNTNELQDLYATNLDKSAKGTSREGDEAIANSIFVLACAIAEMGNQIEYGLKRVANPEGEE